MLLSLYFVKISTKILRHFRWAVCPESESLLYGVTDSLVSLNHTRWSLLENTNFSVKSLSCFRFQTLNVVTTNCRTLIRSACSCVVVTFESLWSSIIPYVLHFSHLIRQNNIIILWKQAHWTHPLYDCDSITCSYWLWSANAMLHQVISPSCVVGW